MRTTTKKIVNTDRLGFRKVHFKNKFYGLDQLKTLKEIDILLGSSVAFGMGSDSDKTSIQSLMSKGERLFSLGIRGGNGHQEILSFLKFKNFFPKVKNVFIFSGINDISKACLENNLYYQDYGGFSGYNTIHSIRLFRPILFQMKIGYWEKQIYFYNQLFVE